MSEDFVGRNEDGVATHWKGTPLHGPDKKASAQARKEMINYEADKKEEAGDFTPEGIKRKGGSKKAPKDFGKTKVVKRVKR